MTRPVIILSKNASRTIAALNCMNRFDMTFKPRHGAVDKKFTFSISFLYETDNIWSKRFWKVEYPMNYVNLSLIVSILSCSLVTGFIFTYAIVVMPGLSKLNDREFIRAFQVTDGIIQIISLFLCWPAGFDHLSPCCNFECGATLGFQRVGWSLTGTLYLLGVQGITISIHMPLNNRIQQLNIEEANDQTVKEERIRFESRWNYFNTIRTTIAFLVTLTFLVILAVR